MWFKNLRVYRLSDSVKHTAEELNTALAEHEFSPCGNVDPIKYGWTSPLGRDGSEFVHAANGYIMICAKRQEKVMPASIVKETLDEQIADIAARDARRVGRAEKLSLKEEIIFSLMPRALAKSSYDYAYIDSQNQLLVVNTSAASRAEDLLGLLRETLGTLKAVPLTPLNFPRDVLTGWLTGEAMPEGFEVGEECELTAIEDGRSVKFKHQNLWTENVSRHIDSGLKVAKLVVRWKDSIECIVDEQFSFKRIKYGNEITDQAEDHNSETAADQFDVEFAVMTIELAAFIKAISAAFGGVDDASGLALGAE